MPTAPAEPALTPDNFYAAGVEWAHGGPERLEGGQLRRYGKGGADACGIFLTRSEPEQLRYAAGFSQGGLYRVKVSLAPDEVFNLNNPDHCDRVAEVETEDGIGQDFLRAACGEGGNRHGALDWAVVDANVLVAAGFRAAILVERPPGVLGTEVIYSLAVFDENAASVVGRYQPHEIAEIRASAHRYMHESEVAESAATLATPADQLDRLLHRGFAEPSDCRFERGDCEAFALALVEQAQRQGLSAGVLYGYRGYVEEIDGRDEEVREQFSHAVTEIAFLDGTTETFDYQGGDAIGRWEQRWTHEAEFTDVNTGKTVRGLDFSFSWTDERNSRSHREPFRVPDKKARERLSSLLRLLSAAKGEAAPRLADTDALDEQVEATPRFPRALSAPMVAPTRSLAAPAPAME